MKLLGFLDSEAIVLDLAAMSREEVVRELVDVVAASGGVDEGDKGPLIEAILDRERQGSTGIGGGIALPHTKESPYVKKMLGAFGRASTGISYGAIDGEPVQLFFLLVSPKGSQEYKPVLTRLARMSRNDHFLRFLREAKDVDEIVGIIEEMTGSVD